MAALLAQFAVNDADQEFGEKLLTRVAEVGSQRHRD